VLQNSFPEHGSDALKLLQKMLLKLWPAISFWTKQSLRSRPCCLHIWGVHAHTDWHHVLLCALNELKQNRHRDNWIPLLKPCPTSCTRLLHKRNTFLGVCIEQLREVANRFVSVSPSAFLHETTSTERICLKMNISGFNKKFSILFKFSESRLK